MWFYIWYIYFSHGCWSCKASRQRFGSSFCFLRTSRSAKLLSRSASIRYTVLSMCNATIIFSTAFRWNRLQVANRHLFYFLGTRPLNTFEKGVKGMQIGILNSIRAYQYTRTIPLTCCEEGCTLHTSAEKNSKFVLSTYLIL